MRGLISVTFSDTCTSRMNKNIVISMNPHFYKKICRWHVHTNKEKQTSIFQKLNSYHLKIKKTIEKNPAKFLDTEIIRQGCEIETKYTTSLKSFQCICQV